MSNEVWLLFLALVDLGCVFIASRLGREWLLGTIAVNLILVGLMGSFLITAGGLTTNAGNVFYSCVFFATYFLVARHDASAVQLILFGVGTIVFFTGLAQLSLQLVPASATEVSESLRAGLAFTPRVFFASMIAYLFAQYANIILFVRLRARSMPIWLAALGATVIAQAADSSLFFTIAFFDLDGVLLLQSIVAGWLLKVVVVALGAPLLLLEPRLRGKERYT